MTYAWKQYSQPWLKIPQILRTLLFRSVHKAQESFCSQEYNLAQFLTYNTQTSWHPAEIQTLWFPLNSQAWIISCSKGPGNQRGRRTAKHWSSEARSEAPPRENILPGTVPAQSISFHEGIKSGFLHWVWNTNHKQAWTQLLGRIKQKKRKFCYDNAEHLIPPLQIKQIHVKEKSSHPNQWLPGHAISNDNFKWEPPLQSQ